MILTIKKQYFEEIKKGLKTIEYREVKPFYNSRFKNIKLPYIFILRNGRYKNCPEIKIEVNKIIIKDNYYNLYIKRVII